MQMIKSPDRISQVKETRLERKRRSKFRIVLIATLIVCAASYVLLLSEQGAPELGLSKSPEHSLASNLGGILTGYANETHRIPSSWKELEVHWGLGIVARWGGNQFQVSMMFFQLGRSKDPIIDFTGRLYNEATFGERREPPEPGRAFGRICRGGREWYDCLSTTYFHKGIYVVSERVAIDIQKEKLVGLSLHEVVFEKSENPRLPVQSAPVYYWTLFEGQMAAKVYSSEGKLYPFDGESKVYVTDSDSRKSFHLDVGSWDGSDFFFLSTGKWGFRFVSERVVEAAKRRKWTNFSFLSLSNGSVLDLGSYQKPIDYLS